MTDSNVFFQDLRIDVKTKNSFEQIFYASALQKLPVHSDCNFSFFFVDDANRLVARGLDPRNAFKLKGNSRHALNEPNRVRLVRLQYAMRRDAHFADEKHDYGESKRMAAYSFLARHLKLKIERVQEKEGKVDESFVVAEDHKDQLVFGPDNPRQKDAVKPNPSLP